MNRDGDEPPFAQVHCPPSAPQAHPAAPCAGVTAGTAIADDMALRLKDLGSPFPSFIVVPPCNFP